jgi:hypothetical protein
MYLFRPSVCTRCTDREQVDGFWPNLIREDLRVCLHECDCQNIYESEKNFAHVVLRLDVNRLHRGVLYVLHVRFHCEGVSGTEFTPLKIRPFLRRFSRNSHLFAGIPWGWPLPDCTQTHQEIWKLLRSPLTLLSKIWLPPDRFLRDFTHPRYFFFFESMKFHENLTVWSLICYWRDLHIRACFSFTS